MRYGALSEAFVRNRQTYLVLTGLVRQPNILRMYRCAYTDFISLYSAIHKATA